MHVYLVIVGALAVWRITHLLSHENGPAKVLTRLRNSAVDGFSKRLFGCFYCLSLWVAAPLAWAIGRTTLERILMWLAFSGGAILAERGTGGLGQEPPRTQQALYEEDEEDQDNVMLRSKTGTGGGQRKSN